MILISCKNKQENKIIEDKSIKLNLVQAVTKDTVTHIPGSYYDNVTDSIYSSDYLYYADSIIKGHKPILCSYFRKYNNDTCFPIVYGKKQIKEGFKGFKSLGDLNNDFKDDSVFILEAINTCDNGQSYYFTDTLMPRIMPDSYCCGLSSIFKLQDINEDGISEIGIYHSSCASRYKSVIIYSLMDKNWKKIAVADFDTFTQDPSKVKFENIVRKISKNKFEVKNFIEGKIFWKTHVMK